jgi:hypothetical protein
MILRRIPEVLKREICGVIPLDHTLIIADFGNNEYEYYIVPKKLFNQKLDINTISQIIPRYRVPTHPSYDKIINRINPYSWQK